MSELSALETLDALCVSNHENKLKKMAAHMEFVLPGVALRNQVTVINGPPGIGKTACLNGLLVNASEQGLILPDECFIFNSDDNPAGIMEKQKILKPYGINIFSTDVHNMHPNRVLALLEQLIIEDDANGKIFVFDTIKKFNDMMSKFSTKEFFRLCRTL